MHLPLYKCDGTDYYPAAFKCVIPKPSVFGCELVCVCGGNQVFNSGYLFSFDFIDGIRGTVGQDLYLTQMEREVSSSVYVLAVRLLSNRLHFVILFKFWNVIVVAVVRRMRLKVGIKFTT